MSMTTVAPAESCHYGMLEGECIISDGCMKIGSTSAHLAGQQLGRAALAAIDIEGWPNHAQFVMAAGHQGTCAPAGTRDLLKTEATPPKSVRWSYKMLSFRGNGRTSYYWYDACCAFHCNPTIRTTPGLKDRPCHRACLGPYSSTDV